jgi:hypothetical protein
MLAEFLDLLRAIAAKVYPTEPDAPEDAPGEKPQTAWGPEGPPVADVPAGARDLSLPLDDEQEKETEEGETGQLRADMDELRADHERLRARVERFELADEEREGLVAEDPDFRWLADEP